MSYKTAQAAKSPDFQTGVGLITPETQATEVRRIGRRRDAEADAPLSYSQEAIWFLEQMQPGSPAYNVAVVLRVRGSLVVEALEKAFNELLRRHEILRTNFRSVDGTCRQIVVPHAEARLEIQTVEAAGEDEKLAKTTQWAARKIGQGFNLAEGSLIRLRLMQMDADDHVVVLCAHHIICDGWSVGLLVKEMALLYEACRQGKQFALPEPQLQYADFAEWQREQLNREVVERELEYWKQQLADAPPVLDLPLDRPRPAVPGGRGETVPFSITGPVLESLLRLGQKEGATLFMTLLGAFHTLLHYYSAHQDVVVGTPFLGRTSQQTSEMIGLFLNSLSIRIRFEDAPSFREIVRRSRTACIGAFANATLPFGRLVTELNPKREASHTPIFQTWFLLGNWEVPKFKLPNLEIAPFSASDESAKFDLLLLANEKPGIVSGNFRYNVDLFQRETVERMALAFTRLLRSAAKAPDRPCDELFQAETTRLSVPRPSDVLLARPSIEKAIEQQAAARPHEVALVFGSRSLTYAELNAEANQLAEYLRRMEVGPEVPVVVRLERSVHSVVALLAILKAGGVYVPLDPTEPEERASHVLRNICPAVLITHSSLRAAPENKGAWKIVCLDIEDEALKKLASEDRECPADPSNLAYAIFTSGSTGRPKGVAVSRESFSRHCAAIVERFQLSPMDRVLQFTATSFDVWLEQLLPTMSIGAMVYMRGNVQWSGVDLLGVIQDNSLTVANLPTAYWQTVTAEWGTQQARIHPGFRLMIVGGEAMSPSAAERWLSCNPPGELLNAYGPTEATITTSFLKIPIGLAERSVSSMPIDRPLPDRTAAVLNESLHPVPDGAPGELCIGGTLARGYFGMPAETAERFIPNPFALSPGERLYRTGDIVRLRPDNAFDFLGRRDHQVKIRGYRIELQEIEAAIKGVESVRDAVAKIWKGTDGDPRLVAYVSLVSSAALTVEGIRDKLRQRLPEYMLPSLIMLLDSLPLTVTGKIDRQALLEPVMAPAEPQTLKDDEAGGMEEFESEMAGLFKEILKVPSAGRNDDFFEIGGHSLLAVQLGRKIREQFGFRVSLPTIFRLRTVSAIAKVLREMNTGNGSQAAKKPAVDVERAISRADRNRPILLSHAQERLWLVAQLEPGSAAYNIPLALRVRGALDISALERAFAEIIRRHEALRTVFRVIDGGPRQVTTTGQEFRLEVLEMASEKQARQWIEQDMARGFDLSEAPLLRVKLLRLGPDDYVVALNMHHIVSDGWSIGVLVREMGALYQAYAQKLESPLPELKLQYADYAMWQRDWLQGEVLERELGYWKRQLAGAPTLLRLPLDRERPAVQSRKGETLSFNVDPGVLQKLRHLAQEEGATLFMVLLAAFQSLLHCYSGQTDIVIGTDDANRLRGETEDLIGFFINQLALRSDLSGNPVFRKLLQRVRQTTLDAYAHNAAPFEKVVDALKLERTRQHEPVFQVKMVMQNTPREEINLPGISLENFAATNPTAKLDLALFWVEAEGQLHGSFNYAPELFSRLTIEKYQADFQRLLAAVAENCDATIQELGSSIAGVRQQPLDPGAKLRNLRPAAVAIHQK